MDHRASSIRWLYPMLIDSFVFVFFFLVSFLMNDCVKSRIAKTRAVKRSFSVLKRG